MSAPQSSQQNEDRRLAQDVAAATEPWYLKEISFGPRRVKVITQNFNGPCSFIAICNILLLRGAITIEPASRESVSYNYLSQLVGEYLLMTCPDIDISAALSIMPLTQTGMDLNPVFTNASTFRPGSTGGELALFRQAGIDLVHGWLIDPQSPDAAVIAKTPDYDSAVMLVAEADHISNGKLVLDTTLVDTSDPAASQPEAGASSSSKPLSPSLDISEEHREKIRDAIRVREFLEGTSSQLTYHGLFHLASTIKPGTLVALFRNLHLSVLYKRDNEEDQALYSLVTDQVFLREPWVVWERLEDVDGGSSTFVDSDFVRASPAGGDFAGQTAEQALRAAEHEASQFVASDPADLALAQQLQAEEDNRALAEDRRHQEEYERKREADKAKWLKKEQKRKDKKDCVIM
ncbi:hypothetical protein CYLTODRAFT_371611 [Cylindrobasidium torrendii FP15055 ss-10]|uniref:MINDY deubiquitinase domain-containing protein n=1 Tax=Cylindrobasidium torrendii FP15055 ss-10 TaxID=1314674 RepID=A0A0D7BII3_9AGAR|nr:hypothetical protein CYLTODRAFT_371611 [Cylindrobasidium torrendii FP15055 ss-10]